MPNVSLAELQAAGYTTQAHVQLDEAEPITAAIQEQIVGVDTDALLRLGEAAMRLHVLPPRASLGLYTLPSALKLVPLIEKMQSDTGLEAGDVLPYRKPILEVGRVSYVGKLAAAAEAVKIGAPNRALDRKLERDFPIVASKQIEKAREAIANIEKEVDFVAGFENPKQQFTTELEDVAKIVTTAILAQRDTRVRSGGRVDVPLETPGGITGFFAKAFRSLRNFFGRSNRVKLAVNPEVTAYDAGAGIHKTFSTFARDPETTATRLPLLSKLLLSRLPNELPLSPYKLAALAPELLGFLFSTTPEDEKTRDLLADVQDNPHEFRFMANKILSRHGYWLGGIQAASRTLLPAIRDILPTQGSKVREIFAEVQALLQNTSQSEVSQPKSDETPTEPSAPRKGIGTRLKSLFRRKQ